MDKLTLYIGNKNYSSWSFRPWIALEGCGIAFEEVLIPFDFPAGNPHIREVSPTGKVPMLVHDGFKRLGIARHHRICGRAFPRRRPLAQGSARRAPRARSISMEMLSGFRALRNACPMNIRRPVSRHRSAGGRHGRRRAYRDDLARDASPVPAARSCSALSPLPMRCLRRSSIASRSMISSAPPTRWTIWLR